MLFRSGSSERRAIRGRRHHRSVSDEPTTETDENAIAAPAIIGCKCTPHGRKSPIASGMPVAGTEVRTRRRSLGDARERTDEIVYGSPQKVHPDLAEDPAREVERGDDVEQVGPHEDNVGRFDRNVGSTAQCDAHVGYCECW